MPKKGENLECDWNLGQNIENGTLTKELQYTEDGKPFISKQRLMTILCHCRESEVSQENGGRKVYRAEGLKELPNTACRGRCGTDEADGRIDDGCAVGKRLAQGSPIVLVSQLFNPGTSLSLPTSLSVKRKLVCVRTRHRAWSDSAPCDGDGNKPLSTAAWQSSVHRVFELYSVGA